MRSGDQKGTSLIELMWTLAIVAILMAMAVASYAWVLPWVREKLGLALTPIPDNLLPKK